jgi:hypothetical protein
MSTTYKENQELNELSKEVFGTSSRWRKIVNNGVAEPFERDREVMVPTSKGMEKKTFTDKKSIIKHYTVEEVHKLMLDILESRKPKVIEAVESPKE